MRVNDALLNEQAISHCPAHLVSNRRVVLISCNGTVARKYYVSNVTVLLVSDTNQQLFGS